MRKPLAISLLLVALVAGLGLNGDLRAQQKYSDFSTLTPLPEGEWLVIGFPGGREKWNNPEQICVRLADRLRGRNLAGVHIETVENKHRRLALDLVRNAFDRNRNGQLEAEERANAKIILYGQSMGGAAVVKAARELNALGLPVQLTVQIDSVGIGDEQIPTNVLRAANLYQPNGRIIHGEKEIRAMDPARTQILGNFGYDYSKRKIPLPKSSHVKWYKRLFYTAHTQMEFDPEVWGKTEGLILDELNGRHPAESKADSGRSATPGSPKPLDR